MKAVHGARAEAAVERLERLSFIVQLIFQHGLSGCRISRWAGLPGP